MTCSQCNPIKRLFCLVACKDMTDALCAADNNLMEAEYEHAETWQIWVWAAIIFIVSVVASCEISPPVPGPAKWHVNPELKYRANQQIKEAH